MNTSTPVIRLGLLALTGAVILGAAALHSSPLPTPAPHAASALPIVMLDTVTVRPDPAQTTLTVALPVLPTVHVRASEEEIIAARIDPSDRIQILAPIVVQPGAEAVAAAMHATAITQVGDEEEHGFLVRAVAEPHRLRLDMPYYSFGKVLTHSSK